MSRFRRPALLALLIVAGTVLRFVVVGEFHAPAGDGHEYHKLAHELRRDGRYAYAPPPAHLSFGRMPGYPLLLTALERDDKRAPMQDIEEMLVRGTFLNVLFDALTALLVFFIVREAGLGEASAWLATAATVFCPLLLLNCCYLLRESFATLLTTGTILLLVRALQNRRGRLLLAGGALTGLTMLVRVDAFATAVGFLPPWARLDGWRRRIVVGLGAAALCIIAFSPWPIRNQLRFGDPHAWGATWPDANGDPYPTGVRAWMRTWIDDLHEGWMNLLLTNKRPIAERDIHPRCFDSPEEKKVVAELFTRYDKEGLSPAVDRGFQELAARRTHEHPLRTLVWLPIRRAAIWWWAFTPAEEQPLRSAVLGQPRLRYLFEWASHATVVLGVLGLLLLALRREHRAFAGMLALVVVSRSLLMSIASPDGCQRYLSPIYPLALIAAAALPVEIARLLGRARGNGEPSLADVPALGEADSPSTTAASEPSADLQ